MTGQYIGLDLGTSMIKAVSIEMREDKPYLVKAYALPTPEDSILDGSVINFADMTEQVAKLMESGGFPDLPISLGVKGAATITKYAKVPYFELKSLTEDIRYFSEQYLAMNLDEYALDYKIISLDKDIAVAEVVFAAISKEVVSDYVSILESASQKLMLLDSEALALCDLYNRLKMPDDDTTMILDIGECSTKSIFLKNGNFAYHDSNETAGAHCSNLLMKLANIPKESLDLVKANPDAFPAASEIKNIILKTYLPDLNRAVESALSKYKRLGGDEPSRIYLSGGGAMTYSIKEVLNEEFKINIGVLNPDTYIEVENPIARQILEQSPAALNVAIAMALHK